VNVNVNTHMRTAAAVVLVDPVRVMHMNISQFYRVHTRARTSVCILRCVECDRLLSKLRNIGRLYLTMR